LGLKIFTTRFNKADGYGDGYRNDGDKILPGGRPTLQNNGTFLRANGLDSQTCLECHAILSTDSTPMKFGVGGSGTINNSAMFQPRVFDVGDIGNSGQAFYDGRLINPISLFGVGGVQLLGQEMTEDLQALKAQALNSPGTPIELITKGVYFGSITANEQGELDISNLEGVDEDLVVKPFGRKGEFASVRQFDTGATEFHFGIQPVEIVGEGVDGDNDGVSNEINIGEISVLEIFLTTMETPQAKGAHPQGFQLFQDIGCTNCHLPSLSTRSKQLNYRFPEVNINPLANIFTSFDLSQSPPKFALNSQHGLEVLLFSDLKRHDMGDELAESFHLATEKQNREFITAKLWGVADTAPYLHDGRALTLNKAILLHGGEAQDVISNYTSLGDEEKNLIIEFLYTLRNPDTLSSSIVP
jgi:hypothetical protein